MKILLSILSILLFQTCQPDSNPNNELIIWVNSAKVECTGVRKMTCMQIQKSEVLDFSKDWELFYSQIEGFDYIPGYLYKLKIKTETIENPPADGSSIKYTLIEILEKNQDTRYNIHDIYVLKSINEKEFDSSLLNKQPSLEINITKMQIFGNNGCNNFSGSISFLNGNNISFGPIRETKMMCENMEVPNLFSEGIAKTKSFIKNSEGLHLINDTGKIVLTFKKVD